MRFFYFILLITLVACTPKQQAPVEKVQAVADTLITKVPLNIPPANEDLEWSSLIALMESLREIPAEQRAITLKNIKEETIKMHTAEWPETWNANPIRSRFTVFLTHVSLAADQRFDHDVLIKRSTAINQMMESWNVFAALLSEVNTSTLPNTAVDELVLKSE